MVLVLLIAGNPAQVGAILLHLIREGLLRATEFSCNSTVGDALRVILPKLDDGIGFRVKLTQSGKELLQQHAVGDDFFHRLTAVGNIVTEGAVWLSAFWDKEAALYEKSSVSWQAGNTG